MITVYLVDDQRILREGLRALLELDGGIHVVGESAEGRTALDGILAVQPEVVLMDITMPDLNGIDATKILMQKAPHIKVIILSVHSDSEHVYRAFQAGASGYLLERVGRSGGARGSARGKTGSALRQPKNRGRVSLAPRPAQSL